MASRVPKLRPGEEITPALIDRLIDGVNRNRLSSPDHTIEQTSLGTDIANMPRPVEEVETYPARAFQLIQDTLPSRIIGGGATQSPPDAELTPDPSVAGFFLDDPTRTPTEFYPPDETWRDVDEQPLFYGIGRKQTNYHQGTLGWARWVPQAHEETYGDEKRWVGQWQIITMYASQIADAKTLGPYNIVDSGLGANDWCEVTENLIGLIHVGDLVETTGCALAHNRSHTVIAIAWQGPNTRITVDSGLGFANESSGQIGKIVGAGGIQTATSHFKDRGVARILWVDENRDASRDNHVPSEYLLDSGYDVEFVNQTSTSIRAGTKIKLYWDRQEYRWRVLTVALPSLLSCYLAVTENMAKNAVYEIDWTQDFLEGADILQPLDGGPEIELRGPGLYEINFNPSYRPAVGNVGTFQVDLLLDGVTIWRKNVYDAGAGPASCCTTHFMGHVFRTVQEYAEIKIEVTELNVQPLDLQGNAVAGNPRCELTVKRITLDP